MIDEQRIAEIIAEALDSRSRIDAESHAEHHAFIASMIKREQRRQQVWDSITQQVLGWGAVAVVGAIGTAIIKVLSDKASF